jgi:hypothetical protein
VATASPPQISLDKVVQAYNAIRDHRTAKRHAWEQEDLALEEDQNKLKVLMLGILNQTGAESIRTEHGTAFRTLKTKPSAADWSAIYDWIVADPSRFELLEKRVKSTFIKDYMEANGGALPPGINVHQEYEVSVRRPNTASGGPPTEA